MTKTKEEYIREILSDYDNIVNVIKSAPQTYNTILQKVCYKNGTMQQILRRKISKLLKLERIWRMRIPGTRFGVAIFCTPNHDYKILVSDNGLVGVRVFYFYDYKDDGINIILNNYWELKGPSYSSWEYNEDELVLKKFSLRGGVNRFWD